MLDIPSTYKHYESLCYFNIKESIIFVKMGLIALSRGETRLDLVRAMLRGGAGGQQAKFPI